MICDVAESQVIGALCTPGPGTAVRWGTPAWAVLLMPPTKHKHLLPEANACAEFFSPRALNLPSCHARHPPPHQSHKGAPSLPPKHVHAPPAAPALAPPCSVAGVAASGRGPAGPGPRACRPGRRRPAGTAGTRCPWPPWDSRGWSDDAAGGTARRGKTPRPGRRGSGEGSRRRGEGARGEGPWRPVPPDLPRPARRTGRQLLRTHLADGRHAPKPDAQPRGGVPDARGRGLQPETQGSMWLGGSQRVRRPFPPTPLTRRAGRSATQRPEHRAPPRRRTGGPSQRRGAGRVRELLQQAGGHPIYLRLQRPGHRRLGPLRGPGTRAGRKRRPRTALGLIIFGAGRTGQAGKPERPPRSRHACRSKPAHLKSQGRGFFRQLRGQLLGVPSCTRQWARCRDASGACAAARGGRTSLTEPSSGTRVQPCLPPDRSYPPHAPWSPPSSWNWVSR